MEVEIQSSEPAEAKKSRKRHKRLFKQIKDQMEFYFSDANLHKDRYIKKLMDQSEDKYIELAVFSNFNKLRALTEDMSMVAKALASSELLEVSEDKLKVRRTRPLSDPRDVDDRTVYVECLPMTATHYWVKKIFQECGNVVYVSLPKYRTSKDIKGFGFVEFETTEEAQKACQMLHNPPTSAEDKLGKFPRANKQLKQLENKARSQKLELPGDPRDPRLAKCGRRQRTVSESAATENRTRSRKRRRTTSEGSDSHLHSQRKRSGSDSEPPAKQSRSDHDAQSTSLHVGESSSGSDDEAENEVEKQPRKRKLEGEVEGTGATLSISPKKVRISEDVQVKEATEVPSKAGTKHRKRKRKTKEEDVKREIPELRVIPKCEWSKLRQEYLQLQKTSMSQLKKTLRDIKQGSGAVKQCTDGVAMETADNIEKSKARGAIEFIPNVIVKVTGQQELSRKDVKDEACKSAEVVYADIPEGCTEGYLRCPSEPEASKLLSVQSELYTFALVQGADEEKYWDKLKADRENKLSRKTKTKPRGRDKIFKKVEKSQNLTAEHRTHVIFDDD